MHANKSAHAIGMWQRHYAKRARGRATTSSPLVERAGDEDLVWLKLESKNHQLATLAINIVISLFITGTSRVSVSSWGQLCILQWDLWALLIVHLDDLCIYHWLLMLIISLSIIPPERQVPGTQGCIFAWSAPILSWPRIMCSQVRMLKFLEPSREMPQIRVFEGKKIVLDFP